MIALMSIKSAIAINRSNWIIIFIFNLIVIKTVEIMKKSRNLDEMEKNTNETKKNRNIC